MTTKKQEPSKLDVAIRIPKEVFGSELYTVFVDITNSTDNPIDNISVTPQVIPGSLLAAQEGPENVELKELEAKKRQIVREMESQISIAYESKMLRDLPPLNRYLAQMVRMFSAVAASIEIALIPVVRLSFKPFEGNSALSVPAWAKEALRVEDWDDILRLEEIINYETPDSFVRKAFLINKEKLHSLMERLKIEAEQQSIENSFKDVYTIQAGELISFPFKARAPMVFRARDHTLQFVISYSDRRLGTTGTFSANQDIRFDPSSWIISAGVVIGAVMGFIAKTGLVVQQEWFTQVFWGNLG